ncbi:MAG: metalloregulator ArsR/SmtB family transcription factor [Chloroflexota bacterium]|nr:metalloregulator ArsR/SmtB family transcription factor [Chloroflexota bacterium]
MVRATKCLYTLANAKSCPGRKAIHPRIGPAERCQERGIHPEAIRAARDALIPDAELASLAETFAALADSNRMKMLFALAASELCVCDIAAIVGVTESAISQHLRVLRDLRWVKSRREGRMVYYSLQDQHVRTLLELELEHARGG